MGGENFRRTFPKLRVDPPMEGKMVVFNEENAWILGCKAAGGKF